MKCVRAAHCCWARFVCASQSAKMIEAASTERDHATHFFVPLSLPSQSAKEKEAASIERDRAAQQASAAAAATSTQQAQVSLK